jgi:hypothetical protein
LQPWKSFGQVVTEIAKKTQNLASEVGKWSDCRFAVGTPVPIDAKVLPTPDEAETLSRAEEALPALR